MPPLTFPTELTPVPYDGVNEVLVDDGSGLKRMLVSELAAASVLEETNAALTTALARIAALEAATPATAPVNTSLPTLSGSTALGGTLTAAPGVYTGSPTPTVTRQWQRNGTNISGATGATRVIVSADQGTALRVVETATNASGTITANSAATNVPAAVVDVAPGVVTSLAATPASSTQINVSWSAPATGTTPFTYDLRHRIGSGSYTTVTGVTSPRSITGLAASQAYNIEVRANGPGGTSSWATTSATTSAASAAPADGLTGLVGGWGFRRLRTDHAGAATRLLRVSDNVQQDIALSGNDLDNAAAATFLGASAGKVVKMYDQFGGGRDLVFGTGTMPDFVPVSAGTGRAAMRFNSADDRLATTQTNISLGATMMLHVVGTAKTAQPSFGRVVSLYPSAASEDYNTTTAAALLLADDSATGVFQAFSNTANRGGTVGPVIADARFIANTITTGGTTQLYLDGVAASSTSGIGNIGPGLIAVGHSVGAEAYSFLGEISEIILTTVVAHRPTLQASAEAYFVPAEPPVSYAWAALTDNIHDAGASPYPLTVPVYGVGAAAGTVTQVSMQFRQGDFPSTHRAVMKRASTTAVVTQTNVLGTWNDGSVRNAVIFFADPGIANGVTENFTLNLENSAAGTPLVWATVAAGRSASMVLGSQTVNLLTAITATDVWNGPLAVVRRGRVPITGMGSATGGELSYTVMFTSDGLTHVDFDVQNHGVLQTGIAVLTGNVSLTVNGTQQRAHTGVTIAAYQSFMRLFHRVGTTGTNMGWPAYVHSLGEERARVGVVENYDWQLTPDSSMDAYVNGVLTDANADTAMARITMRSEMNGTGAAPEIGVITQLSQMALQVPTRATFRAALIDVYTQCLIPWHFRLLARGEVPNPINSPNIRFSGHNADFTVSTQTQFSAVDAGHQGCASWVPWLLTGSLLLRDEIESYGFAQYMENAPTGERGNDGGWLTNSADTSDGIIARRNQIRATGDTVILGNVYDWLQVRANAWLSRGILHAAWAVPPAEQGGYAGHYIDMCIIQMKMRYESRAENEDVLGELHGIDYKWFYGSGEMVTNGFFPPWQNDMRDQVYIQYARLGIPYALEYVAWSTNFAVGRYLSPDFNWADGMQYNLILKPGGTQIKTWAEVEPVDPTYGDNFAAVSVSVSDDYPTRALAMTASRHDLFTYAGRTAELAQVDAARALLATMPAAKTYSTPTNFRSAGFVFNNNIVPRGTTRA